MSDHRQDLDRDVRGPHADGDDLRRPDVGETVDTPNRYWSVLGGKHAALLDAHGLDGFKRTVNWHYFSDRVESYRDFRLWALVRHFARTARIPWPALRATIDRSAGLPLRRPTLYARFVGLVWARALELDRARLLDRAEEPTVGMPVPITYRGRRISHDLAASAIEVNWMREHGVDFGAMQRVMEIGAGYGRLAWLVLTSFPHLHYAIYDIEPARTVSQWYLTQTLGARSWSVEPPAALGSVAPRSVDLTVNISSFDEMHPDQVAHYCTVIDRVCRGWVYLKAHREPIAVTRAVTGEIVAAIDRIPIPATWKLAAAERDPLNAHFEQRLYRVDR